MAPKITTTHGSGTRPWRSPSVSGLDRVAASAAASACGLGVGHDAVDAVAGLSSLFTAWPPNSLRSAAITLLPKPSGWRDW